jgi:hypothetical protein
VVGLLDLHGKTWLYEHANVCLLMRAEQPVREYKSWPMNAIVTFCEFVVRMSMVVKSAGTRAFFREFLLARATLRYA